MAFQDNSGTIILDAVLTDIGRKKMTQGRFSVTHFGLGDDEIDYSLGEENLDGTGTYEITEDIPILEALGGQHVNIKYGLLDLPRNDILYLPQIGINRKIENAVSASVVGCPGDGALIQNPFYLAVNLRTAKKVKSDIGPKRFLQNNSLTTNAVVIESGIQHPPINDPPGSSPPLGRTKIAQERFLLNLGLMDKYYFVYCDSRLIDHIYVNPPDAYFKNDAKNNFYTNMQPLVKVIKSSIGGLIENYETYHCIAMNNEIYRHKGSDGTDFTKLSAINGPRGTAMALNFKLVDKLVNSSASQADDRFTIFGTLNSTVLGGSNIYDYIDTNIMIEGTSSGRQLVVPLRIIRYRTT